MTAAITKFPAIDFKHFAGADWLGGRAKVPSLSRLGTAVADVLGYVHQGIYHIDDHVLRNPSVWASEDEITLSTYGELATYDFPLLTLLILACDQMGLAVDLRGSKPGYLRQTFFWSKDKIDLIQKGREVAKICPTPSLRHVRQFMMFTKPVRDSWEKDGETKMMMFTEPDLAWERLVRCAIAAHHMSIRVSVSGYCPSSLQIHLHKRDPNGEGMGRWHPQWEEVGQTIEYLNKKQ